MERSGKEKGPASLTLQVTGIPVVFMSALEGRRWIAIMCQVIDTYERWCLRLSTSWLNRWLCKVMSKHSWKDSATQPEMKYFAQGKARPPTFVAFMSGKVQLSDTDIRFLTESLKEDFDNGAIPIRLVHRSIPRKETVKSNSRNTRPRINTRMRTDKRTTVSEPHYVIEVVMAALLEGGLADGTNCCISIKKMWPVERFLLPAPRK